MFSSLLDVLFIIITALCRWISHCFQCHYYLFFWNKLFFENFDIILIIEGCKNEKEWRLREAVGFDILHIFWNWTLFCAKHGILNFTFFSFVPETEERKTCIIFVCFWCAGFERHFISFNQYLATILGIGTCI